MWSVRQTTGRPIQATLKVSERAPRSAAAKHAVFLGDKGHSKRAFQRQRREETENHKKRRFASREKHSRGASISLPFGLDEFWGGTELKRAPDSRRFVGRQNVRCLGGLNDLPKWRRHTPASDITSGEALWHGKRRSREMPSAAAITPRAHE